jgi:CubicO group peptidase (beta-lactamase class C family)
MKKTVMNIDPYVEVINRQNLNVEGIIVLQHGRKIAGYRWVPETPRPVYSVSKSFLAIAAGMAIDDGKLSLKDRVIDIFPGIISDPDPRLKMLNLEHLLTMSRGYPRFTRPKNLADSLAQPLSDDPGSRFVYDSTSSFLASAMITQVTGLKVRDLLIKRLFEHLDIPDPFWTETEDGYTTGSAGLEVSTSSLATFGQFLLQRGSWKGRQLVPAAWIDGATRAQITTKDNPYADHDLGYGYQFWMCRYGAYRCDGKAAQYVIVLPRHDAVIAVTSEEDNARPVLYALWDTILPKL